MLRIIVIFILIYLLFRLLTTVVFPLFARWYLNRYKKRFYRDNPRADKARKRQAANRREQRDKRSNKQSETDKIGEYVDFEEIKDDNKDPDNE
ncbi:MAG: hypothetical protein R6U62_02670 [Bacteroidales bacterium]